MPKCFLCCKQLREPGWLSGLINWTAKPMHELYIDCPEFVGTFCVCKEDLDYSEKNPQAAAALVKSRIEALGKQGYFEK